VGGKPPPPGAQTPASLTCSTRVIAAGYKELPAAGQLKVKGRSPGRISVLAVSHWPGRCRSSARLGGTEGSRNVAALERSDNVADCSHAFAGLKRGYTVSRHRAGK